MTAMLSFAHDFESGGIYYKITSSSAPYTVAVTYQGTSYYQYDNEYTGAVNIPATVTYNGKTYSVTSIEWAAFSGCSSLTSIIIPNSVTSIGSSAFEDCSGLTSITIPNSVTSIDYGAFYGCSGLTSVNIPNSVTSIGDYAFAYCSGLKSVTIPNSVTSIGGNVFEGTAWYNNLPNGLVYAGKVAYKYKGTMPDNTAIVLEEGTTGIANNAFYNCSGLTTITIPNSVTTIGDAAFFGCYGLTSIEIPNSVTTIGGNAFYSCSGLTSIEIPNSVTSISSFAFQGCIGLTSVTIPNSVTSIGDCAFGDCYGLTSIEIPNSVTRIGYYAFGRCSGLNSIEIPTSVTSIGSDAFYGTAWYGNQPNGLVYAGKVAYKYKGTMPDNTAIVLEEGTTVIADNAFYNCSGLTSVTIPGSVTAIGGSAFHRCSGLTSVTIPNCVTSIGGRAFYECSGLTSITIPNSVTSIGSYAFEGCYSLTTATIGNNMRSIGWGAFRYCSGLTSISIPNSVMSIYDEVFSGCSGLKEITSYIQEPFYIYNNCWNGVNKSIPLYVPVGTKEAYQSTGGWKDFTNIIEFGGEHIEPATEPKEVDMAVVPDQMDLDGMVVGDTYYVLDAENGDGADSENGCVVINTTTTEEAVDGIAGKDVSDASVKAVFKGFIFMVPAGTGTVSINAETLGTSSLMVKIGSQAAQAFQLAERATVQIPYTVAEPTYIYIYAGTGTQAARSVGAARAAAAENSVKVYSYKWEPTDPTGISSIDNSQSATDNEAGEWYTIDGRKLSGKPVHKGIYIVNGRKVAVK